MHAFRERTRSHNPTLWVVTTTGDQHCRALHGMSKRERNGGLRALPAHVPAPTLRSKSSISLLEKLDFSSRLLVCFPLFHRNRIGKPGFGSGFQARKARFSSPKPGRNRTKNRPPKPPCARYVLSCACIEAVRMASHIVTLLSIYAT